MPGGQVQLRFAEPPEFENAERAFADGVPDDEALTLRLPSDGGIRALREVLDRLDAYAITADELAVQTPDLDDVFLTLTGQPATVQKGGSR